MKAQRNLNEKLTEKKRKIRKRGRWFSLIERFEFLFEGKESLRRFEGFYSVKLVNFTTFNWFFLSNDRFQ